MKNNVLVVIFLTLSLSTISQVVSAQRVPFKKQKVVERCSKFDQYYTSSSQDVDYSKAKEDLKQVSERRSQLQSSDSPIETPTEISEDEIKAYYNLGISETLKKDYPKAIDAFKKIKELSKNPIRTGNYNSNPKPNVNDNQQKSNINKNSNDTTKLDLKEIQALSYIRLGDLYSKNQEFDKAFNSYRDAIVIDEKYAGYLYGQTRSLNDVLPNSHQEINSKDPQEDLPSYLAKGYLYARQQRWKDAEDVYTEAIHQYNNIYAIINRGYLYISWMQDYQTIKSKEDKVKKLNMALEDFEMAKKIEENPFVYLALVKANIMKIFMVQEYGTLDNINKYSQKIFNNTNKYPSLIKQMSEFYNIAGIASMLFNGNVASDTSLNLYKNAITYDCLDSAPRSNYTLLYYIRHQQEDNAKTLALINKIKEIDPTNAFANILDADVKSDHIPLKDNDPKYNEEQLDNAIKNYIKITNDFSDGFITTIPIPYYYNRKDKGILPIVTNPLAIAHHKIRKLYYMAYNNSQTDKNKLTSANNEKEKVIQIDPFFPISKIEIDPVVPISIIDPDDPDPVNVPPSSPNPKKPVVNKVPPSSPNPKKPVVNKVPPSSPCTDKDDKKYLPSSNEEPFLESLRSTVVINATKKGSGTGWVVKQQGDDVYIVTNRHVVFDDGNREYSKDIKVLFFNNRNIKKNSPYCQYKASILPLDPTSTLDVAVLLVKSVPMRINPFKVYLGPISRVTQVKVIGHPQSISDLYWIVTQGNVLGYDPHGEKFTINGFIDQGNSGGPIITEIQGEKRVIGMIVTLDNNTAKVTSTIIPTAYRIKPIMCLVNSNLDLPEFRLQLRLSKDDCKSSN